MKYFGFLARFIMPPLVLLHLLLYRDRQQGKHLPNHLQNWRERDVLLGHIATAVLYTTPWDNYLVATQVWSYNPKLVTGHTIGWVPIEEYSFFVLQSLLTGAWWQYLAPRLALVDGSNSDSPLIRYITTSLLGTMWAVSTANLLFGQRKHRYLTLILSWSLPPIMLQTAIGGDILWHHRQLVIASIIPTTLYLSLADSVAIGSGTWMITPEKTIKHEIIPNLPFEELLFFFVTNVMLIFGMTLVHSRQSENRLPHFVKPIYLQMKSRLQRQGK